MRIRPESLLLAAAALAAGGACAAELGTLFHTPQERERLERLRRGETPSAVSAPAEVRAEVTGFVRRSDGRGTVWINGVPVAVAGAAADALLDPEAVRRRSPPRVRIERRGKDEVKR